MPEDWNWESIKGFSDTEELTFEYPPGKGRTVKVSIRGLTAAEKIQQTAKVGKLFTDERAYLHALAYELTKLKVVAIAGHPMTEKEWSTQNSDFMDFLAFQVCPSEMLMATAPVEFVKKLSEGYKNTSGTSSE